MCTFYLDLGFGTHIYLSPAGGTYAIVTAGFGSYRQEFLSAFRTSQFRHYPHLLAYLKTSYIVVQQTYQQAPIEDRPDGISIQTNWIHIILY
jgi:hypothetical protein